MFALEDLRVSRSGKTILSVDSLQLGADGVTVIIGHNGSGKSTLVSLLARQIPPDSGRVVLDGCDLERYSQRQLAQKVSYLPQRLPPVAGLDVRELTGLGRFAWRGTFGRLGSADRKAVEQAMLDTGCAALSDHTVDTLSGGERQRAWIAMLLAQAAPVLVLDEPTAALDLAHAYDVMMLLHRLSREAGRQVIVILHDINLAARYADRIVALKAGHVAFDGPPQALLEPTLLPDLYGVDMVLLDHPDGRSHAVVA